MEKIIEVYKTKVHKIDVINLPICTNQLPLSNIMAILWRKE